MRTRRYYPAGDRPYFTLLERDGVGSRWGVSFGAYTQRDVDRERKDRVEHGVLNANMRIIRTACDQRSIQAAVDGLNAAAFEPSEAELVKGLGGVGRRA